MLIRFFFSCLMVVSCLACPVFAEEQEVTEMSAGAAFGGIYTKHAYGGQCRTVNPITDACTCPSGFVASQFYDLLNPTCANLFYSDNVRTRDCGIVSFFCYKVH